MELWIPHNLKSKQHIGRQVVVDPALDKEIPPYKKIVGKMWCIIDILSHGRINPKKTLSSAISLRCPVEKM